MSTADEIREAEQRQAASLFITHLSTIAGALGDLEKDPTKAAEGLATQDIADAVALLQDLRTRLTNVERDLIVVAGRREGRVVGSLSDGRQFTLERASDRKEWDHDDWKRDVRRTITTATAERFAIAATEVDGDPEGFLVDTVTGQEVTLGSIIQEALATAQEVHGSTAPRSRALKALGLYAGDYATSSPAGWRFGTIKLDHSPSTTKDTEEKTTDA